LLILSFRHWEQNEEFFIKVKEQLIQLGNTTYLNMFTTMENYIRWKGKEDSAKFSGKSMLRTFITKYRNIQIDLDINYGSMEYYRGEIRISK